MFKRILIANRGEIAVRLIRACHELGVEAIVVYSDADADALHTRLADAAVNIGPPPAAQSYLDIEALINAAEQTRCEAIHPGYGFLSESPDFATAVRDAGLVFIGPPADAIRKMGVKTEARTIMEAAGVPVVPGYQAADASVEDFAHAAAQIGYPVMVKAAGGGGGKGIRIVYDPADLPGALGAARREAQNAFGDPSVFLEKYIERGRHIEIQVLADQHGNTVHLFERECSIQRRHQKIIEESPSPFVTSELRARMGQAAVDAAEAVGYVNAGTVEFIVDARDASFYFLEMNTRLQVEHPVTEMVTGVDLAIAQIRVAAGNPLPFTQDDLTQQGHAVECRVYAEDPANNFLPETGLVLRTVEPAGPGIRVDAGVVTGEQVTIHYDPMIAKVIAYAASRKDAIRKMDWALAQYVILGVTTNLTFLRDVLSHPAVLEGDLYTRFVDERFTGWLEDCPADPPPAALIALALSEMHLRAEGEGRGASVDDADRFSPWARADGFRMGGE